VTGCLRRIVVQGLSLASHLGLVPVAAHQVPVGTFNNEVNTWGQQ